MAMPTTAARVAPMRQRSWTDMHRAALLSALSCALVGCSTGAKRDTIPSDGPTMADIYRQHMAGVRQRGALNDPPDAAPRRPVDDSAISAGERSATRDIAQRFARLPNPDLVMYVPPHLSPNGRYPVPGYTTVFPMYENVEYALPGETSSTAPWSAP
jgi:conjugative transfer region lipoprotein (TIGR03751 family)